MHLHPKYEQYMKRLFRYVRNLIFTLTSTILLLLTNLVEVKHIHLHGKYEQNLLRYLRVIKNGCHSYVRVYHFAN